MTSTGGRPWQGPKQRFAVMQTEGVPLAEIADRVEREVGDVVRIGEIGDCRVRAVQHDHREVSAAVAGAPVAVGDLFCCVPGSRHDGHDHAGEARALGAVAFLCERDLGQAAGGACQLVVAPGLARAAMARAACVASNDPASALTTVGVTGTNGKTTTTYLVASILSMSGFDASVVGTTSGVRTTPESPELQRRLRVARVLAAREGRPGAVAIEVTSHALAQRRVDGYVHDVAVFTNLSQDHLDYHGTMEAYFEAKTVLFTPEHAKCGVANGDDDYGRRLLERAAIPMEPFSIEEADGLVLGPSGSRFVLRGHPVRLPLIGRVNVENAVAAAAAARALGTDDATIAAGLTNAVAVPGRFEVVATALGVSAVVDFAHTPAGLEQACRTLKDLVAPAARLVVVFGAGGDRDHEKRRPMGHAVSTHSDVAVVTSDNPRHEDPLAIIDEVVSGCDGTAELHVEPDRRRAISLGLSLARPGDVVLVAGKGHERTQQIGDELVDLDDRAVVAEEANRLAGAT